jgi:uncharacterized membrane protein YdjX (TVP38/TMEM64 family)
VINPRLVLLLLLFGLAAFFMVYRSQIDMGVLELWLGEAGPYGPVLFMLMAATAIVFLVPATLFLLVGGVLFGPLLGALYSLMGVTLGATLAFLIARYIAADWIAAKSHGRFKTLIDGVESEGWRFVAFTRLVPIFPFFLLSYAFGLTRIKFYPYIIATFVCTIPGVAAITYFGYLGKEALAGGDALVQKALVALGLLAMMVYLPRFVKRLHEKKDRKSLLQ